MGKLGKAREGGRRGKAMDGCRRLWKAVEGLGSFSSQRRLRCAVEQVDAPSEGDAAEAGLERRAGLERQVEGRLRVYVCLVAGLYRRCGARGDMCGGGGEERRGACCGRGWEGVRVLVAKALQKDSRGSARGEERRGGKALARQGLCSRGPSGLPCAALRCQLL